MSAAAPVQPPVTDAKLRDARESVSTSVTATGLWRTTAVICATFTLLVAIGMLVGYKRSIAEDPIGAKELAALRERLHATPTDEALKRQIRAVDLRERQRYFARVQRNESGAWLLALGSTLFVLSAARFYSMRRSLPVPRSLATPAKIEREVKCARGALVGTAAVLVIGLAAVGTLVPVRIAAPPSTVATLSGPAVASGSAVTPALLRAQWPRFRGADGAGFAAFTNIPITWNSETGGNIAWKTAVPLPGHNSPVIWGNKLFLTGSSEAAREIFCFDVSNGALLWRVPVTLVPEAAVKAMDIPKMSGAAAATAACDDKRVFAMFATGELVAADHSGRIVWTKNFGKLENPYGHASSLVIWRDRLIVQLDQGSEEAAKSRLYAFDVATGKIIWQQPRALPSSWTTPLVIGNAGAEQIVCVGQPWLASYSFSDGKEIWRYDGFGSDLTPSPISAAGLVVAISPSQRLIGIRPDGHGDVSKTHTAWLVEQNVPDISSPASDGELLFTMETSGTLVCLEAITGKKLWEHAYDGEFQSSPAIAGQRVYVSSTEGDTFVVSAAREFKELAHNTLAEPIRASPAFTDGRMFVRAATNLYAIAAVPKGASK